MTIELFKHHFAIKLYNYSLIFSTTVKTPCTSKSVLLMKSKDRNE